MRKNTASQVVGAQMTTASDGSNFSGTVTVYVTGDGGTQALGSVGAGVCAHEGNGFHTYLPAQAETNYDHVAFTFIGSGAISATVQLYPVSYDPTDGVRLGLTALPNAAADAAGGLPISDAGGLDMDQIKTDTTNIETDTQDIQSRLPAALVTGRMSSDAVAISGSTVAADNVEANIGDLDAAVSSRSTLTAAQAADGVWDEVRAGHVAAGSFGQGVASVQGDVTGNVDGSVAGSVASVTADVGVTAAGGQTVADEVLNRNLAGGGSGNTRNVRNSLRALRNRAAIAGGTLTVYQENDSSAAWTAAVTTTAGNPISQVDPA